MCEEYYTLFDEDEEVEEVFLQLSAAEALASEDSPHWITAMEKERLKLAAFGTWRNLSDDELKSAKRVVPLAIVLTRKRDQSFKARCVVLGNLYQHSGESELHVYAPVLSQPGSRYLVISAISNGDHLIIYDIDNAFCQAEIDADVYIRLPKLWRAENDDGVRKLVRALYGLPQSPRLWSKKYELQLKGLGWEQSTEKGLWRKRSAIYSDQYMKLGVYVDDNTACGPDLDELRQEVDAVLRIFPGKIIQPEELPEGWLRYDLLGADLLYKRSTREMKLTMQRYIEKLARKFRMENCRKRDTPIFCEKSLYDEQSPVCQFPLRECVGSLQWAATVARPDICSPTNAIARVSSRPCTRAVAEACKRIIRYLVSTADYGICYSPQQEMTFNEIYGKMLETGKKLNQWNLFSDASFASDFKTLKSVSGGIMYYKSCPVAWKSSRQSVRTQSTFEAEFVAGSDGLILSENLTFKGFYEGKPADETLWMDNATAIQVAKTPTDAQRPRSRHVALRYYRVKDACEQIAFAPTEHMKADTLTKINVSKEIRDNIFYHNPSMFNARKASKIASETDCNLMFPYVNAFFFDFSYLDIVE